LIVAFDTSILILLLDEKAKAPKDPKTGAPVEDCRERLTLLVDTIAKAKGSRIIIPTPALAEFFVGVTPQGASVYHSMLSRIRSVTISPFSIRAAFEFAELQRQAIQEQKRLKPEERSRLARPKFDHQIVAIARAEGATKIYSDDDGLSRFATRAGIETIKVHELPLPPRDAQGTLPFESPTPTPPIDDEE
jgi:predicted nucleic acid-binding protein